MSLRSVSVVLALVLVALATPLVRAQPSTAPRVLTIPCKGTVGVQITAKGVGDALSRAKRQKIERVIFEIDSEGGFVYEASAIMDVLREHAETFEMVALVEGRALSAATVFLAGADAWLVTPGATIGAAVSYSQDDSTGNVDVDAKFNAAWSSSLAGLAEQSGWPGDLFRAMVERGVTLYAAFEDGATERATFSRTWPEDKPEVKRIDTAETVLALNASELVELGLAKAIDESDLEKVATLLEWGDVRTAGRYGATVMNSAAREREKLSDQIGGLNEELTWHVEQARQTDPRGADIYYDRDTMQLTPASQRLWAQKAQVALGHWTSAERLLKKWAQLDKRAERAGALHLRVDHDMADEVYKAVAENVAFLRANMRKTHHQLEP
ncbi:MAG: ATP-dependent Clp protease proteolytic subunit [Planctomycetota bacterium]